MKQIRLGVRTYLTIILVMLLTLQSSFVGASYSNSTPQEVDWNHSFLEIQTVEADNTEIIDENNDNSAHYRIDLDIQYQASITGGGLFVLFDLAYEEHSGFTTNEFTSNMISQNGDNDPEVSQEITAGDRFEFNVLSDADFLIGYYFSSSNQYEETRELSARFTSSDKFTEFKLNYTLIAEPTDGELQQETFVYEDSGVITYETMRTQFENGFAFTPLSVIPIISAIVVITLLIRFVNRK